MEDWWVVVLNFHDNPCTWIAVCAGPFDTFDNAGIASRLFKEEYHEAGCRYWDHYPDLWTREEHKKLSNLEFWPMSSFEISCYQQRGVQLKSPMTVRSAHEYTLGRRLPSWPPDCSRACRMLCDP